MWNKRKPNTKRRARTTTRRNKTTRRPTGVFKKKVLSVIKSVTEDKSNLFYSDPYAVSPILNSVTDLRPIIPQITLGSANNQRIGDNIKGKYIDIKGHIELATSQQTSDGPTRVLVRLMVLSDKKISNMDQTNSLFLQNLIDYGSGQINMDGSLGNANNIRSAYMPLNRNVVTVHHEKLFYLNAPRQFNTTGTQFTNVNFENTIRLFKIRLKCSKILKYTDNSNFPQNYAPYLCACFFQLNGGANNTSFVRIHYASELKYEDN